MALDAWPHVTIVSAALKRDSCQLTAAASIPSRFKAAIADARRSRQFSIVWLDLTNAFGSVSHETIFTSLQWAGLSEEAISVIRRLYTINTTNISSHQGLTSEISIQAGVNQGCPFSPIIFNLTMEPIIRAILQLRSGYSLYGGSIDALAYADDLTFVSERPEGQVMLDTAGRVATLVGLISIQRSAPRYT